MNSIVDRILDLMAGAHISARQLTKTLDMSSTAITDWKKGKANPSLEALIKIAKYFHVSLDFLIFGELENNTNLNDILAGEEMQLVKKYRKLNTVSKEKAVAYIDGMLANSGGNCIVL